MRNKIAILCLLTGLFACGTPNQQIVSNFQPEQKQVLAKNVILMIGDGMGLGQITAGMYANENHLNLEKFPVVGLQKTYSYDNLITDSAASATAIACGVKTYNNAIGVDMDTLPVKSILELAEENGLATGMIVTSSVVHGTPGPFVAHVKRRQFLEEIALGYLDTEIDFLVGGGKKYFDRREDERNIYKELENDLGNIVSKDGDLKSWAKQGVLLLNATLTVRAHQAGSHQKKGWETFTDEAIKQISKEKEDIIFLLWGGFAKKKSKLIDKKKHHILESGHPSPLSANRGYWFGNEHFSKTNMILKSINKKQIEW